MGNAEPQDVASQKGRSPTHPVNHHLGDAAQGQLQVHGSGFRNRHIGSGAQRCLEPIGIGGRDDGGAHPSLGELQRKLGLKPRKPCRYNHLKGGVKLLQLGGGFHDVGQHEAQLLPPRGRHQQEHRGVLLQPQELAGGRPAGHLANGVEQGMAHVGDVCTAAPIKAGLLLEDRQDLIRKADQVGAALGTEFEGPLLGSDVIGDRHLGKLALEAQPQAHVWAHVIDQHHPIRRLPFKPTLQPALQPQGGQHKGDGLQQANGPHPGGIGQQNSPRPLHPLATKGYHLQDQTTALGLRVECFDQKGTLEVPRHLARADQQTQH